jgi:hypothetical protein
MFYNYAKAKKILLFSVLNRMGCAMKKSGFLITLVLFGILKALEQDSIPYPSALDASAVTQTDLSDIGAKGMLVGNGELNGIVYSSNSDIIILVSKNDVWDGRVNTSGDGAVPSINPATHSFTGPAWNGAQASWNNYAYPTPVPVGNIRLSSVGVQSATLDIKNAVATVTSSAGKTVVRVLAQSNCFCINSTATITLKGSGLNFLPGATTGTSGDVQWLRQNLPGDGDWKGMDVYMALGKNGSRQAVAVVTSLDTTDPLTAAVNLVNNTLAKSDTSLVQAHDAVWSDFWTQSGLQIAEPALQRRWYREVYCFRCYAKKGATGVGLRFGQYALPVCHGTFKFNYNEQQGYAAAGPINHPELAEPLIDVINNYWPRARWLAATSFVGCEGGFVHSDVYTPWEPDPAVCTSKNKHQSAYLPWGYSLGMLGHIATNMWEYFQYKPDTTYLSKKIYPIIKDMALFYCSFIEKCRKDGSGKYIIGPSYFPEDGVFGQDNTSYDIVYINYCLNVAKEAAAILKADATLINRIDNVQKSMPDYSMVADPSQSNQTIIEAWKGAGVPKADRHGSDIQAVYPAGLVNWFSPKSEKDLLIRTINKVATIDETNAYITLNIARARLGLVNDAYDNTLTSPRPGYPYYAEKPNGLFWLNESHEYYITEQTAYARLVSELLLQSVGNIIRVFPAWPATKDAKYKRLRAQGGFLVSAEMSNGVIGDITVQSTAGGSAKLVSPWPAIWVKSQDGTSQKLIPDSVGVVNVSTVSGRTYVFQKQGPTAVKRPNTADRLGFSQHLSITLLSRSGTQAFTFKTCEEGPTTLAEVYLYDISGRQITVGTNAVSQLSFVIDCGMDRLKLSPGVYCLFVRYGKQTFRSPVAIY